MGTVTKAPTPWTTAAAPATAPAVRASRWPRPRTHSTPIRTRAAPPSAWRWRTPTGTTEFCFEVNGATHVTLAYDESANVVTKACEGGTVFRADIGWLTTGLDGLLGGIVVHFHEFESAGTAGFAGLSSKSVKTATHKRAVGGRRSRSASSPARAIPEPGSRAEIPDSPPNTGLVPFSGQDPQRFRGDEMEAMRSLEPGAVSWHEACYRHRSRWGNRWSSSRRRAGGWPRLPCSRETFDFGKRMLRPWRQKMA